MYLAILTKRQYMRHDLVSERFWKYWEFPRELANRGHHVLGLCLSYKSEKEGLVYEESFSSGGNLRWISSNLGKMVLPGFLKYIWQSYSILSNSPPDCLVAAGDSIYGAISWGLASKLKRPYVFEIYDDFRHFSSARFPGVQALYSETLSHANQVVAFSSTLAQHIQDNHKHHKRIATLENAVDLDFFTQSTKEAARTELGINTNKPLIGMTASRGSRGALHFVDALVQAVLDQNEEVEVVLTGDSSKELRLSNRRVHSLGVLPHNKMATFTKALDVYVVNYEISDATQFCFPTRLLEAIACSTPVVAPYWGEVKSLFPKHPFYFFDPKSDPVDVSQVIFRQLSQRETCPLKVMTWVEYCDKFEAVLNEINLP